MRVCIASAEPVVPAARSSVCRTHAITLRACVSNRIASSTSVCSLPFEVNCVDVSALSRLCWCWGRPSQSSSTAAAASQPSTKAAPAAVVSSNDVAEPQAEGDAVLGFMDQANVTLIASDADVSR